MKHPDLRETHCSTCPISCGCAWGCLRGDDLAEIAVLREALMEIAMDHKTYTGHGTYDEGPHTGDYCQKIARDALGRANGQSDSSVNGQ